MLLLDLPEATNAIFLQKDRVSLEDKELNRIRFQLVHCVYFKALDPFLREDRVPRQFATADADIHHILGMSPPPESHQWWIVSPCTPVDQTKAELTEYIHHRLLQVSALSSLNNHFNESMELWNSSALLGVRSKISILIAGVALGRQSETAILREHLLQHHDQVFVRNIIKKLDS